MKQKPTSTPATEAINAKNGLRITRMLAADLCALRYARTVVNVANDKAS